MAEVGVRYTSIQTFTTNATYTCKRCGFTSPVEVTGVGSASASASHLLGDYGSAQGAAQQGAAMDARADVDRMLGLVPCPSCNKRDAAGLRRFYVVEGLKLAGVLAVVSFGVLFIFHSMSAAGVLIAWAIALALAAATYLWAVGPLDQLQRARLCVKFPRPEPTKEERERSLATLRTAIETVANVRKIPCSERALERIRGCDNEETLRRWAMQSGFAESVDDVVGVQASDGLRAG